MDRWPQRTRFKALVTTYRANHGLTRKEVAVALGLAEPTLHNYLYNRRLTPSIDVIQRAARLFGVSITEMVDDPGSPTGGLAPELFAKATAEDRSMIQEVFRDLIGLEASQKRAAFDLWKAGLKALSSMGPKKRV